MNRITPKWIKELNTSEIFVFGSNEAGIHGAGAALDAILKFEAELFIPSGLQGKSYAIPTKTTTLKPLPIEKITIYVKEFINFAKTSPKTFLVTEIGCGYAGYKPEEIAPLFKEALDLTNVYLPESFINILNGL
jgi:hypothetical protein